MSYVLRSDVNLLNLLATYRDHMEFGVPEVLAKDVEEIDALLKRYSGSPSLVIVDPLKVLGTLQIEVTKAFETGYREGREAGKAETLAESSRVYFVKSQVDDAQQRMRSLWGSK